MRVGLIAPPWVPVPPPMYGGTEQVVDDLVAALKRMGHEVRLFSVGDSTCAVDLSWYYQSPPGPMGSSLPEAAHVLAAYAALDDVDVIHDHTLLGGLLRREVAGTPPVVVTNHGVFTEETRAIFGAISRSAAVVAISHDQRSSAPDVPVASVIPHGIDLRRHRFGSGGGGYVLFVGRMSADKGLHRAIRVARRAGRRLVFVSKMWAPDEIAYFDEQVRPLLGDDVRHVQPGTAQELRELYRHAEALLNPIRWREPFGLVMAEALASGTPVLAFPEGAAREIVEDGRTGFLCPDEPAMVWGLEHLGLLDRRRCRQAAEDRFDVNRMALDHVRLYERVIAQHQRALGPVAVPPPRVEGRGARTSATPGGTKVPGPPAG
jgi:glycosyltransferase involved in cell wall biosynthesis